eukprot:2437262-Rhodomonas_salina.1
MASCREPARFQNSKRGQGIFERKEEEEMSNTKKRRGTRPSTALRQPSSGRTACNVNNGHRIVGRT